jgi:phage terminase small subunit
VRRWLFPTSGSPARSSSGDDTREGAGSHREIESQAGVPRAIGFSISNRNTGAIRSSQGATIKPRTDLNADGKAAWKRAVAHVEGRQGDLEALADQILNYARAVDRSSRANAAWRKAGRPLTATNPNGAAGPHPLLKVIEDADRAVWRYGRALGLIVPGAARRVGRPTIADQRKAHVNPMPPSPSQTLRKKLREDPRLNAVEEKRRAG